MSDQDTQRRPTGSDEKDDRVRVTNSLPLMAYFMMEGIELVKAAREGAPERFCFYYRDPDDMADALEMRWINSRCHRFDSFVKSLRDMITAPRSAKRRKRGRYGNAGNGNGRLQHAGSRQ